MMRREMTLAAVRQHDRREAVWRRRGITARLAESRAVWRLNGRWERYYATSTGRLHAVPTCPTLIGAVGVEFCWWLSGAAPNVVAHDHPLCRRCWGDVVPAGRVPAGPGRVCAGSGQMARCRCGGSQCRQACPVCGADVLITRSGVLRRHGGVC